MASGCWPRSKLLPISCRRGVLSTNIRIRPASYDGVGDFRTRIHREPPEHRFEGDRVRIRRVGRGVLLEPLALDPDEWFREMDGLGADSRLPQARDQPLSPRREIDLG